MGTHQAGHHRNRTENGTVLVIVLIFITVFGLIAGAYLSEGEANLKTTSVVHGYNDKLYAADGSIEHAIQSIRTGSACANVGAPQSLPTPPGLNRQSESVTCQTTAGSRDPGSSSRYAVITTDPGASSLQTQSGTSATMLVKGAVYVAGGVNLQKPLSVDQDDMLQHFSSCAGATKDPSITVLAPYTWKCTTDSTPDPAHALPTSSPVVLGSSIDLPPNCRLFLPGKYTAANPPNLLSGSAKANYFASGVYYFEGVNLDVPNTTVLVGGAPSPGESQVIPGATPCATDAAAPAGRATGTGVRFIFGKNAGMTIGNNTGVELYSRIAPPAAPEGTDGISVQSVTTTVGGTCGVVPTPGAFCQWTGSQLLNVTTGGAAFTSHGMIYGFNAPVSLFASNGTIAQALSGVVAFDLTLQASVVGTGLAVQVPPGNPAFTPRQIIIRARATGSFPITSPDRVVEAVVKVDNDRVYTTTVLSWRAS